MKLLALVIASVLAAPAAFADDDFGADVEVLNPPSGPVYVEVNNRDPRPDMRSNHVGPQDRVDREQRRMKNKQLRRALMDQFDVNGDGRLGPRERMRAVRVLGKIQRKLAGRGDQRPNAQRFIQRFDTNGDGNVDRGEMPPKAMRKMRKFDRDRDGWIEPGETR